MPSSLVLCFQLALLAPAQPSQELARFAFERPLMGTEVRIVLYAADSAIAIRAATAALDRIAALESVLSDYDPDSEASRLSALSPTRAFVPVSADLFAALEASLQFSKRTGGAFDVTVGPLTRAWRWASRRGVMPGRDRIDKARSSVGFKLVTLDPITRGVRLDAPDMQLDFGGIGKGIAADKAMATLRGNGVTAALVDAGGDLVIADPPPGGGGWQIQVAAISATGEITPETITLSNVAVATSGDAFRFLEVDGTRYSHIIDPRTGAAISTQRIVTVFASTGAHADALASAATVLDADETARLQSTLGNVTIRVFERRNDRWVTNHGVAHVRR